MSNVEEFRRRVDAAKDGLAREQVGDDVSQLAALTGALEQAYHEQGAMLQRMSRENAQLREMLNALLLAVETNNRQRMGATLRNLGRKVGALVDAIPNAKRPPNGAASPDNEVEVLRTHAGS